MLFQTPEFLIFFCITYFLWSFFLGRISKQLILIFSSYLFYSWFNVSLVGLLIGITIFNYWISLGLAASAPHFQRKSLLTFGIVGNLFVLFYFKYTNWFISSFVAILQALGLRVSNPHFSIILPIGISFFTFEAISFLVDRYKGKIISNPTLLEFSLFMTFFPRMISGPIVRASDFIPQLRGLKTESSNSKIDSHLLLIAYGAFKKVVIADNLAVIVNQVYGAPGHYSATATLAVFYGFAFQIYCDFSGYTDMARGIAGLFGLDIGINFNYPYFASNIRDFWSRWHISLSTWLRDYLYIPLGGNRHGKLKTYYNVMITMLLGGLWHGASWTYVIWGGIHGAWIVASHLKRSQGSASIAAHRNPIFGTLLTFHGICLSWVFFRAPSLSVALDFMRGFSNYSGADFIEYWRLLWIPVLLAIDLCTSKTDRTWFCHRPLLFRWCAIMALIFIALIFGNEKTSDFIYFQF